MEVAERGTFWSVPVLGGSALCLVVSAPRGKARGRLEYQVVPIYRGRALTLPHTAGEFSFAPNETSLGMPVRGALWNARPLLAEDLGEQVGAVTSERAMNALRDAYLRGADPSMTVEAGRLGQQQPTDDYVAWQRSEIAAWQPLTGKALSAIVSPLSWATFEVGGDWKFFSYHELAHMEVDWATIDALANDIARPAVGEDRALFDVHMSIGGASLELADTFFADKIMVAGLVGEHHTITFVGTQRQRVFTGQSDAMDEVSLAA